MFHDVPDAGMEKIRIIENKVLEDKSRRHDEKTNVSFIKPKDTFFVNN